MIIEENMENMAEDYLTETSNKFILENQNRKINLKEKEELLQQIQNYEFSITELALYLDTHPRDEKALSLHKKYCKELKELRDKYQKIYGPLTINCPCNKWRWIEEPWPWEGGMN